MYESLFLVKLSSRGEFAKDKTFLFANVSNGKISSRQRCSAKDYYILEDTYNQCDSVYYILYESKIDKCHTELHCLQALQALPEAELGLLQHPRWSAL